jgi:hypothetical protein
MKGMIRLYLLIISVLLALSTVGAGYLGLTTGDTIAQGTLFTAEWALGCPSETVSYRGSMSIRERPDRIRA